MFLASSFSVLCSLLTLLGNVEAQNLSSTSSTLKPPASSATSSTLGPLPTVTEGFSAIGNVLKPTITPYTFAPFPTPSESSIPGVFLETYPEDPPSVGDSVIPNFDPAWAAAHSKARMMVSEILGDGHSYRFCFPSTHASAIATGPGFDTRRKSQYHYRCRLDERSMCRKYPASWRFPWPMFAGTFSSSWGVFRRFPRCL